MTQARPLDLATCLFTLCSFLQLVFLQLVFLSALEPCASDSDAVRMELELAVRNYHDGWL